MMNSGVLYMIMNRVVSTVVKLNSKNLSASGMLKSIMLTSCENRFKMRPIGVVSKNDMGALSTAFSIVLCTIRDVCNKPNARPRDRVRTARATK